MNAELMLALGLILLTLTSPVIGITTIFSTWMPDVLGTTESIIYTTESPEYQLIDGGGDPIEGDMAPG